MKLPRDLSGADLASLLCRKYGYQRVHQVGSHIILETESPEHHRIAIPNHSPLRIRHVKFNSASSRFSTKHNKKQILREL